MGEPLRVWRVYNGMMAFGAVHRIVVARTAREAVEAAALVGFVARGEEDAELVLEVAPGAVEAADFEG